MQRPHSSRHSLRRRILRFGRIAAYAIVGAAALVSLFQLQRSALQTIQQSNAGGAHLSPTPLLALDDVEIRARRGGHPLLHLTAQAFTLDRQLRTVTMTGVTGGADTPALALPGGSPLAFAARQANLALGLSFQPAADLQLTQASADTRVGGTPLHIAAPGLDFRWPHGLARTEGEITAQLGRIGSVQCASISVDVDNRMVNFGPFQATLTLAALGSAAAILPAGSKPAGTSGPAGDDKLHFYGTGSSFYSDNNRVLTIDGPVRIVKGSVTMRTVGVIYDTKSEIATAQAPVTIDDNQNTLSGTHGTLNVGTHIATLAGDVQMSAIPDSAGARSGIESQASQPTHLKCDHLTYNYTTKLADADGHLTVLQTNRTVTAKTGHYDVNAQLITMHGDVDGRSTDGKHLHAPEAVVSVNPKNEWIQVKGPITYEFTVSDQDNPLTASTPQKSAPAKGGAPAAAPSAASSSASPSAAAPQPASPSTSAAPAATSPSVAPATTTAPATATAQ